MKRYIMSILPSLKDIVNYVGGVASVEMIKVIGTNTTAKVEAIDHDKTVVIFGELMQPIADIDSTIGLSRISVLKGYMDLHQDSTVSISKENRSGADVPVEVKFDDGAGTVANYRFMSEAMTNEQVKVPPFKGAVWHVSFEPTRSNIAKLASYQGILGGFEKRFTVNFSGSTLNFVIGAGPTDRVTVPFATNMSGSLKSAWSYPLAQVLGILKLGDAKDTIVMNFSDQGALKIDITSAHGKYSYVLPASKA